MGFNSAFKVLILLLFHGNDGYMNAPFTLRYFVRTSSALFNDPSAATSNNGLICCVYMFWLFATQLPHFGVVIINR